MPGPFREWPMECKVYVGDLGDNATENELDSAFSKYGPLRNIWIARRPPGFAFIEFEDQRDAEDSCRGLDGTRLCGSRVRVEMSSGRSRRGGRRGPPGPPHRNERYYPDDRDRDRDRGRERRRSPPRRRSRSGERHKSYSRSPRRSRSRSADRN